MNILFYKQILFTVFLCTMYGKRIQFEVYTKHIRTLGGCSLYMRYKYGLTEKEAKVLLKKYGYNEIPEKVDTFLGHLLKKLYGPIPLMIETAAVLSAFLGEWHDFVIISFLFVVNIGVDLLQEHKATTALAALKKKLAKQALVLRDGVYHYIDARYLVPGDIVKLKIGDIVPADVTLTKGPYLQIDQSALTGESLPVDKAVGDSVYGNAIVKLGTMLAEVTATGIESYFGKTAELVTKAAEEEVSHFERAVRHIAQFLTAFTGILALIVFAVSINRGDPVVETLHFVLVLLIASIPVALPAVLSVTMAVGAVAISKMKAIVRNISAIEELASIDVLCTDKTGTLTQNIMTVESLITYYDYTEEDLCGYALLASSKENNDPIETPIFEYFSTHFTDSYLKTFETQDFTPFDPIKKHTEAHVLRNGHESVAIIKGAPQVVLQHTGDVAIQKDASDTVLALAEKGYRTLAVAARYNNDEHFTILGLIPMYDPLHPDSKKIVHAIKNSGVSIKMLTGDNTAIARQIAEKLSIGTKIIDTNELRVGDAYREYEILGSIIAQHLTQRMGAEMSDEDAALFGKKVARDVQYQMQNVELQEGFIRQHESDIIQTIERADAFSEVLPEDKYLIIEKLQKNNHIVAMTGDGVNDAPALKKADVGIAVASATEAARAAADLVLLEPGLSVIHKAIRTARMTFERMKGYATFRIAETIRIILFLSLSILVFDFYPLTATMIVILALLNDVPVMMIAYDNAPVTRTVQRWNMREVIIVSIVLGITGVISSFALFYWLTIHAYPLALIQAFLFLKLDVAGHSTLYLTRTGKKHFWHKPYPSLKFFLPAFTTRIIGTLFAVYGIFMEPLGWKYAMYIWLYAFAWWLFNDFAKVYTYKIIEHNKKVKMHHIPTAQRV